VLGEQYLENIAIVVKSNQNVIMNKAMQFNRDFPNVINQQFHFFAKGIFEPTMFNLGWTDSSSQTLLMNKSVTVAKMELEILID
jgi:hypothetical protein